MSLPGCPPDEEKMKDWLRQLVEKLADEGKEDGSKGEESLQT